MEIIFRIKNLLNISTQWILKAAIRTTNEQIQPLQNKVYYESLISKVSNKICNSKRGNKEPNPIKLRNNWLSPYGSSNNYSNLSQRNLKDISKLVCSFSRNSSVWFFKRNQRLVQSSALSCHKSKRKWRSQHAA